MILADTKYTFETLLLASILDNLRAWSISRQEDRPQSIVAKLLGKQEEKQSKYMLFRTAEEFKEMWNKV